MKPPPTPRKETMKKLQAKIDGVWTWAEIEYVETEEHGEVHRTMIKDIRLIDESECEHKECSVGERFITCKNCGYEYGKEEVKPKKIEKPDY